MYGGRMLRIAAGDPGLFSGILKTVSKIAAPVSKVIGTVAKIPIIGPIATKIAPKFIPGLNVVSTALMVGQVGRAVGSAITKGPLKLGAQTLLGPSRPGMGPVAAAVGGTALGAALGAVAAPRRAAKPKTAPSARRGKRVVSAGGKGTRCGCPKGKHHVCFRTGVRSKKRRASGGVSAAQKRARAKFAAASRRGPIRKGAKL
jgi:hypothetical protein